MASFMDHETGRADNLGKVKASKLKKPATNRKTVRPEDEEKPESLQDKEDTGHLRK